MDPITAFGVASTAISLLQTTISLFSNAHTIYKAPQHMSEEIKDVDSIKRDLMATTNQLNTQLNSLNLPRGALTECGLRLVQLCRECDEIGQEVQEIVQKLSLKGRTRFDRVKNSVSLAVATLWKSGEIEELKDKMNTKRDQISQALLVSVR